MTRVNHLKYKILFILAILGSQVFFESIAQSASPHFKELLNKEEKKAIETLMQGVSLSKAEENVLVADKMNLELLNSKTLSREKENDIAKKIMAIGYAIDDYQVLNWGLDHFVSSSKMSKKEKLFFHFLSLKILETHQRFSELAETEMDIALQMGDSATRMTWLLKAKEHLKQTTDPSYKVLLAGVIYNTLKNSLKPKEAFEALHEGFLILQNLQVNSKYTNRYMNVLNWYISHLLDEKKYQESLSIIESQEPRLYSIAITRSYGSYVSLLHLRAQALKGINKISDARKFFDQAYELYLENQASRLINHGLNDAEFNSWFAIDMRAFLDDYISFLIDTNDSYRALSILESNKAKSIPSKNSIVTLKKYYQEFSQLRKRYAEKVIASSQKLKNEKNPQNIKKIQDNISELQANYAENESAILMKTPTQSAMQEYAISAEELAQIANSLPIDVAIISFQITANRVFGFLIQKGTLKAIALPLNVSLVEKNITQYLAGLQNPHANFYENSSKWLYAKLFYPLLKEIINPKQISTIIYSPDSILSHAPLSALKTANGFLIQRYNIINIPSLRFTKNLRNWLVKPLPSSGVICANPDVPNAKLPFQELAGKSIKSISPDNIELLLNSECSSSKLEKAVLQKKSPIFVHIGAHGYFHPSSPMKSFILLSTSTNQSQAGTVGEIANSSSIIDMWDGFEIASSKLDNVELVSLSSCETAATENDLNRDIYGITRSLAIAGVKSLVAPLWSVQDESSSKLIGSFHHIAANKKSVAAALAEAQKKMIEDQIYRHPYYWAAYIYTELD